MRAPWLIFFSLVLGAPMLRGYNRASSTNLPVSKMSALGCLVILIMIAFDSRLLKSHPRDVRLFLWPPLPTIFSGCWGHHPDGSPVDPFTEVVCRPSAWRRRSVPDPREAAPAMPPGVVSDVSLPATRGSNPLLLRRLSRQLEDSASLQEAVGRLRLFIPPGQVGLSVLYGFVKKGWPL
jgi:hypothetical protein